MGKGGHFLHFETRRASEITLIKKIWPFFYFCNLGRSTNQPELVIHTSGSASVTLPSSSDCCYRPAHSWLSSSTAHINGGRVAASGNRLFRFQCILFESTLLDQLLQNIMWHCPNAILPLHGFACSFEGGIDMIQNGADSSEKYLESAPRVREGDRAPKLIEST